MHPPNQPSQSMAGRVTDDVLTQLLDSSRKARAHEANFFRFFGPTFKGKYDELDKKTLVFSFLSMAAIEVRQQFETTENDFRQLFQIAAQAVNQERADEVRKIATRAYKTAEARAQSHARFLQLIASSYGEEGFFDELASDCHLDWEGAEKALQVAESQRATAVAARAAPVPSRKVGKIKKVGGVVAEDPKPRDTGSTGSPDPGPGSDGSKPGG